MKRFINWHKEMCEIFHTWSGTDWYTTAWISWLKGIIFGIIIMILLSGCYITSYTPDPIYEDHPHSTEIYYNGIDVYWGYHTGFYYYYGTPHFYPWWYYYQFIPPYHYHTHSHVHVHCDNGHYVYGHRGPTLNNNVAKDFTPTIKVRNNKDKSFVFPRDWKSSNSTRINKQSNINRIDYNRIFNINPQTNIRPINNNKPIISNNNKSNRNNNSTRNKPRR